MKSAVAALLAASLAVAKPIVEADNLDQRHAAHFANHHRQAHGHAREQVADDIAQLHAQDRREVAIVVDWVTETEVVTEYVEATTTVWFTPGTGSFTTSSASFSTSSSSLSEVVDGLFETGSHPKHTTSFLPLPPQPSAQPSTPPPPPPPSPSAPPAPLPKSQAVPLEQAPAPPPSLTPAPPPATPPTAAVVAAPPPPPPPPPPPAPSQAPLPVQALAPAQAQLQPTPVGSHDGDLTWYTIGLGACGEDDSGQDTETAIVALSYLLMGPESNSNPFCGRTITITAPGGSTATALVKDKCMGCATDSIDVSQKVFLQLFGDLGVGRSKVKWHFN